MSRFSAIFSAAAFVVFAASPAVAQDQPDPETVRIAHQLATCAVRTAPSIADAYVSHGTLSAGNPTFGHLLDIDCLPAGGHPPLDPRLVRGAVFEAMYDRDYAQGGPGSFQGIPALAPPGDGINPPLDAALLQFGECVVRGAPADARSVLAASPSSAAERTAIGGLSPRLSPCMQSGLTVTFSAPVLRGVLAEALYKLSRGAPAMAAR